MITGGWGLRTPRSAFDRLVAGCCGRTGGRRASLPQDRLEILVAVPLEKFLVGTEGCDAPADFFADVSVRRGCRCSDRDSPGRRLRLDRLVGGKGLEAAFIFRRLCGDGLHKRQSLRDQKVAVRFPFHDVPQPPCHLSKKAAADQAGMSPNGTFIQCARPCFPNIYLAAASCRACRSEAAATGPRNRSSAAPSGATAT